MTVCSHISRVKEWGFDDNHDFIASLWDCVLCGAESSTPFREEEQVSIDHTHCDKDPCFGCKAKSLQLSTGDANSNATMASKKWNAELNAYADARRQGIQPGGTSMKQVDDALKASETLGQAYDGNTMVAANKVTKEIAQVYNDMKDVKVD